MASAFTYTDYLMYADAKDVNDALYGSVINGIFAQVKEEYKLQLEEVTEDVKLYVDGDVHHLELSPIVSVNSVTYDGVLYDEDAWDYYNNTLKLLTSTTSDKLLTVNMTFGYTEVPFDLKLAVYRHIDYLVYSIKKDVTSVSSVTNTTGNTTRYSSKGLEAITNVYEWYSKRTRVLY